MLKEMYLSPLIQILQTPKIKFLVTVLITFLAGFMKSIFNFEMDIASIVFILVFIDALAMIVQVKFKKRERLKYEHFRLV